MLQIEYDLKELVKQINQEMFNLSGGQKMFEYKFKDLNQDKEKQDGRKDLIEKIKGVEQTFQLSEMPTKAEDIKLDRKEYKDVDDEAIKTEATNSLKSYLTEGLNEINQDYADSKLKIDNEINEANTSSKNKLNTIDNSYNDKKQSTVNSSIKKGTNRGSILNEQIQDLDEQKEEDISAVKSDLDTKISSLNSQKELLETKKLNALNAFDIAYAVKLDEKISKINEDLATYNQKVQEYNNTIEQKEKEYALKNEAEYQENVDRIMDRNQQLIDFIAEQGRDGLESRMALKKTEMALEFFESMKPADALTMLIEDAELANALGDTAFQAVLEALRQKLVGE